MDEINQLVADYNATEQLQKVRLEKLFRLLAARRGNRYVKFTGDMWHNCFDGAERINLPAAVNRMNREIVQVEAGSE